MPAPTGVSVLINGGDAATNDPDVTLAIAATGADEMAFSNNGIDFSPFEVFATAKAWNLGDFGGGLQEGTRTVTVKVRDTFDNAETLATDTILFEIPTPRIELTAIPMQRMNSNLIDINYLGLEDSLAAADLVTILDVEIDLLGLFAGSEVPLLESVDDSLTDGRVGLLFSNAGNALQLVGDLGKSLPVGSATDIARIRLRAQFGSKIGEYATSSPLSVNVKSEDELAATEDLTGRSTIPGREITLIAVFRNALGELSDTDSTPTIEKILDPNGVDKLGGATSLAQITTGVYKFDFTPGLSDDKGQWSYEVNGDVDSVAIVGTGFFIVADPPTFTAPARNSTCIVFGDLFNIDGTPEIELVRNAELLIFINKLDYKSIGRVPDKEITEYRNLDPVFITSDAVRDNFGNPLS
jgi:hypothetical protein